MAEGDDTVTTQKEVELQISSNAKETKKDSDEYYENKAGKLMCILRLCVIFGWLLIFTALWARSEANDTENESNTRNDFYLLQICGFIIGGILIFIAIILAKHRSISRRDDNRFFVFALVILFLPIAIIGLCILTCAQRNSVPDGGLPPILCVGCC